MRKNNRSFLLMSLISASLLVSVFTIVQAQSPAAPAAKATNWSDPATWPNRKVPVAGDKVTIDAGKEAVLDVNTPPLNGLTIDGKLSFANNKDVELTTEWIMLHGELEIGTEKAPHTRKATITFTDNVKDEDISGVGERRTAWTAGSCSWAEPSIFTVTGPTPGRSCPAQRTPAPPRSRS